MRGIQDRGNKGEVILVLELDNDCEHQIAIKDYYDDVIYGTFTRQDRNPGLIEGDYAITYGIGQG